MHLDAELLGHAIRCARSRHGAGYPCYAVLVAWCEMGVGGQHGERIRRRDEDALADDEVAVPISVRSRTEIGRGVAHHQVIEILGVNEVRIRMMAAEILQRGVVEHELRIRSKAVDENFARIGTGHGMHGVEGDIEAILDQCADSVEIEECFHQFGIVGDGIDDLDCHAAGFALAEFLKIHVVEIGYQVAVDFLGAREDRLGDLFRRRTSVRDIVLDAYKMLETEQPNKVFKYAETGFKEGGQFKPHKTHRNGLSVDFMTPVVDESGQSVHLPTNPLNKFGYNIEFNKESQFDDYSIDYEALGAHIVALHKAAITRNIKIWRVIFDPQLQPQLLKTQYGAYIKKHITLSSKRSWVRHDEHYHVDFIVKCKPL